jgi:hypothetical protein
MSSGSRLSMANRPTKATFAKAMAANMVTGQITATNNASISASGDLSATAFQNLNFAFPAPAAKNRGCR